MPYNTNGSRPFLGGAAMKSADVVVVGAGLAGSSCAFELACRGRGVLIAAALLPPVVAGSLRVA